MMIKRSLERKISTDIHPWKSRCVEGLKKCRNLTWTSIVSEADNVIVIVFQTSQIRSSLCRLFSKATYRLDNSQDEQNRFPTDAM